MTRAHKIIIAVLAVMLAILLAATIFLALRRESGEPVPTASPTPSATPEPVDTGFGQGSIFITELCEKNRASLQDSDGDFPDWVEIANLGGESISLEGWTISDKEDKSGWTIPAVELQPGERLIIFASGKDRTGPELHTDFSLNETEGAYLRNQYGYLCHYALCGGVDSDVSMALREDGSFIACLYPTPGEENNSAGYELCQQRLGAEGLVINEAAVSNFDFNPILGEYYDWVELKNTSGEDILLSDYYLSDDKDEYTKYRLPEIALKAGEKIVLYCAEPDADLAGELSTGFELDSENEQLFLCDGERVVDFVSLRDIPYRSSMGRMEGQGGWFYFAQPSPGAENRGGLRRVSEKPVSLSADGVFDGVDNVTVELSAPGTIRYTTDGSAPTVSSLEYTGPITLTETTVIRAVCFEDGALPSRALSLSYIINEGHSLPVLSLMSDSVSAFENMYNDRIKDLELPGSLSFYEEGGSFTMGCGISMNGETSLVLPKKNMAVRFRGAYGQSTLDYDVYGGGVTEFTNFVLRSGQDFPIAIVRNEVCQELCLQSTDNVITQRSRYCVLYINGNYSGIYCLKEKTNEQQYASIAGVSKESVTSIESPASQDSDFYRDVVELCLYNDMSIEENYRRFCSLVDIDSLIDWVIMEGYCANTDLSFGNVRFVRSSENDGRWRFVFYDLDASFDLPSSVFWNVLSEYAQKSRQIGSFIVPLMENAEFRDRFLTRAGELMSTTLTVENVFVLTDELCAQVEPEVARDYARFGRSVADWQMGVDSMKKVLIDYNWQQLNVDRLSKLFDVSDEEWQHYFGEIDLAS